MLFNSIFQILKSNNFFQEADKVVCFFLFCFNFVSSNMSFELFLTYQKKVTMVE